MMSVKLFPRAAKLMVAAVLAGGMVACDEGDVVPRVSSPDWSAPQEVAGLEVRGRMGMLATTLEPVAEVRLRNTGNRTVRVEVGSGPCAIELQGFADRDSEAVVWEPHRGLCPPDSLEVVEVAGGTSQSITVAVPVTAELQSVLRRYRWIVVQGRVIIDTQVVSMELGELLR
jgi:hypothetical protein